MTDKKTDERIKKIADLEIVLMSTVNKTLTLYPFRKWGKLNRVVERDGADVFVTTDWLMFHHWVVQPVLYYSIGEGKNSQIARVLFGNRTKEDEGIKLYVHRKKPSDKIATTPEYWDCECEEDYIHRKGVDACLLCGAFRVDQPASRVGEVLIAGFPIEEKKPQD